MKRIGLVTCYLNNCGACLQAYALQKVIKAFGNECEILHYIPPHGYEFEEKKVKRIYHTIKSLFNKEYKEYYKSYKEKNHIFNIFRKNYLLFDSEKQYNETELLEKKLEYDIYVCGSDQIWNPLFYDGNNLIYLLDFVPKGIKKIAYAPSIGLSEFPEKYKLEFKNCIEKLDYVSVREKEGKKIIDSICDKECKVVLDPTLLIERNIWIDLEDKRFTKKPYIFCYIFGEQDYLIEFVDYVYKKTKLDVLYFPLTKNDKLSNYNKVKNVGPCQFISLINYAELVITDSFHATAFSINLEKPFYTLLRDSNKEQINMNSRIYNILDITGFMNRLIKSQADFPKKIDLNVDFSWSRKEISAKRKEDIENLRKEINIENHVK